jgi:hypothetical protein
MSVRVVSLDAKESPVTEAEFAEFFAIAPGHTVTCIRYEATGMDQSRWEHEERDALGRLVARYTTSFGIDGSGAAANFQKRGLDGAVLEQKYMPMEKFLAAMAKSS